jgi:uncharacterized membrane protein YesL
MERFWRTDGPIIQFLTKFGQLVILTAVWMICCIPVITIGTASSSFYYAVIKSVRRDVGYPVREFFHCFKRTWKSGTLFTVIYLLWAALVYINVHYLTSEQGQSHLLMLMVYGVLVVISAAVASFLFPALSRFSVDNLKLIKMALCMALMKLPVSVVLTAVPVLLVLLVINYLPVACILFVPGVWCYASTFLIEPVLKRFYKEPEDGEKEWYDE